MADAPDSPQGPQKPQPRLPSLIVGVGASAGGLDAFKALLKAMPADTELALVLVQHLDPDHPSLMAELLSKHTAMKVVEIRDRMTVEAGCVYMIPPGKHLDLNAGMLSLSDPLEKRGLRPTVDHFFRSLALDQEHRAVGIILAGTGSDGTAGLRAIKAGGGLTLAQDPRTVSHQGMPSSAIAAGVVDRVLNVEDMPAVLQDYARRPGVGGPADSIATGGSDRLFGRLLALLHNNGGVDLRHYKQATLFRRVQRRMGLHRLEDLDEYLALLHRQPDEIRALLGDMLIGVTEFFRDPETFTLLEREVIPRLVDQADPESGLRLWVPACATGEEAYSLAMLILERLETLSDPPRLQVFATDINEDALRQARQGRYPPSCLAHLDTERLQRFFRRIDDGDFRTRKNLRETIFFSRHDLLADPPLARMDLISCRNLLIYLRARTQQRLIPLFHFALRPGGVLMLGSSENLSGHDRLFEPLSKRQRIFARREPGQQPAGRFPPALPAAAPAGLISPPPAGGSHTRRPDAARQLLLDACLPAAVVVDRNFRIQYLHGDLREFLDFPQGEPALDLTLMLREHLRTRVRAAVYKSTRENRAVTVTVAVPGRRGGRRVRVAVRPASGSRGTEGLLAITFEPQRRLIADPAPEAADDGLVRQLETELQATREDLHSTVAELESANEALKSSNEEILSMNEELQSTNQELETSTEELRSLNQELYTVNSQLREKLEELEAANDDIANLLSSTKLATLFLDRELRIKRYTPSATALFKLIPGDLGRAIADIASCLHDPGLAADARRVLEELSPVETELRTGDGRRWFVRRVLPYRTDEDHIDGVVAIYTDITGLKNTTTELDVRVRQQAVVADLGLRALRFENLQDLMDEAVRLVARTLEVRFCKVLELLPGGDELLLRAGVGWPPELVGRTRVDTDSRSQAGYTLTLQSPVVVEDLTRETRFDGPALLRDYGVISGISVIIQGRRQPFGVMGAHSETPRPFTRRDVDFLQSVANILSGTVQRHLDHQAIQRREKRYRSLMDATTDIVWIADSNGAFVEPQPAWEAHTGQPWAQHKGFGWLDMLHPDDRESVRQAWTRAVSRCEAYRTAGRLWSNHAQDYRHFEVRAVPLRDTPGGPVQEWVGMIQDVDERHRAQAALTESENRFRDLTDAMPQIVWTTSGDGCVDYVNRRWTELTGLTLAATRGHGRWLEAIHPDDREPTLERFRDALERGVIYESESRYRMRDGAYRWFLNRGLPVRDPDGRIVRWLGTCTDIDDQKQTQALLARADRQKDEFLAMLAHELRNPLAPIRACAQLLGLIRLNDPRLEGVRGTLERQTNHLARLVDDLLDVSRITRGRIELRKMRLRLDSALEDAVATVSPLLDSHRHRLELKLPRRPLWLDADPTRLTQIIANLLNNASKYTPEAGHIVLSAQREGDWIVIQVQDNGQGIPPDQLERIFDLFNQAAPTLDRSSGGLGLGLTLVKRLTQMHGGDAEAHSEGQGRGSRFLIRLPAAAPPAAAPAKPPPTEAGTAGPRRILVVDDNRDVALSLAELLKLLGHQARTVYDGRSALELLPDFDPEVVLLDIGLPELNGYQVARRLRTMAGGQDRLLIAITGYGQQHDWRQAMAAGFDHHLLKPVDIEELKKLL